MSKKVTFTLPKHIAAEASEGVLLGDFNDWNTEAGIPLTKNEDGSLTATIELVAGQAYQYRYLLSGGRWENDDTAAYYAAAHGLHVENCVVVVEEDSKEEQKETKATTVATPKKATAKKTVAPKKEAVKTEAAPKKAAAKKVAAPKKEAAAKKAAAPKKVAPIKE